MKKLIIPFIFIVSFLFISFTKENLSERTNKSLADENWYLCSNCCETKKATSAPWESGCKSTSSGTHNFQFCGNAGNYNYTCRKCDAEVYLTSSTTPSASKCCVTGGSHSWYHK
jgi:hypothetical protein